MSHASDPFRRSFDGASPQAVAVLAMLPVYGDGIISSYDGGDYTAEPRTDRWSNGREQGYVISVVAHGHGGKQLNIAFFEHRNTDSIHAVMFEANTYGEPPSLAHLPTDHPYHNSKNSTNHQVGYGKVDEMAEWINHQLGVFWVAQLSIDRTPEEIEQADIFGRL